MLMLTGGNTGPQTGNTCLPLATTGQRAHFSVGPCTRRSAVAVPADAH